MTKIQTRIREQHQKLVAAFVSADRNALVQQQDVIDAQQDLLKDHDLRWGRAYVSNKLEDAAAFERFRESIHNGLDWLGFAPGVGAVPDLLNAVIYFVELDFGTAFLSVAAALPALGDGFKASTMLAKGAKHADEGKVIMDVVRRYGADAVSSIPESRRIVGKYWLDEIRKKVKDIKFVDGLARTAEYDPLTQVIKVNAARWLAMSDAQRVTVIFHELWHHKEGLTKIFPKVENWIVDNTAIGVFFSEGMAQFYGSLKVWPSLVKGWKYVGEEGFSHSGLLLQSGATVSAVWGIIELLGWEWSELNEGD